MSLADFDGGLLTHEQLSVLGFILKKKIFFNATLFNYRKSYFEIQQTICWFNIKPLTAK